MSMLYARSLYLWNREIDIVLDDSEHLLALLFHDSQSRTRFLSRHALQPISKSNAALYQSYENIAKRITDYSQGIRRNVLSAREIAACIEKSNATAFKKNVWRALMQIPYGEVTSYGCIANSLSMPNAARAIGNALAKNTLPIVLPCHRVVLQNYYNAKTHKARAVKNYAGGKVVKENLLRMEGALEA